MVTIVEISYNFANDIRMPSGAHTSLFQGIRALEAGTCLKFVQRSNQRDYLDFFVGGGCYSQVGRRGGRQEISLGNGCWYSHTVSHEVSSFHTSYYKNAGNEYFKMIVGCFPFYRDRLIYSFSRLCMHWVFGMSKCVPTVINMFM